MQVKNLAIAKINKEEAVAGSLETIKYELEVLHPIDDNGFIKIVLRTIGDFGVPQFDNPTEVNYCSVTTTGDCKLDVKWDPKGNRRPWGKTILIKVMGGYLDSGDIVTFVFGDKSKGSLGWQMQTFCEETFEFKTYIDHIATVQFIELEKSPELKIVPGVPAKAVCLAPSQVKANTEFNYFLKLEDCWGNPTQKLKKLVHQEVQEKGTVFQITATDEKTGLSAQSNPIKVVDSSNDLNAYWADFHGQSEESIGTNTIDDYFSFARDYSKVDVCGHQANDFQVTDEFWDKINSSSTDFNKSGEFITFPGYEWSGNTPLGGDRNIYFTDEKGLISRSSEALLPNFKTKHLSSPTATKLFKDLSEQSSESFAFAHVGGRYANMEMHDENIEIAMEIHSAWGTFEWLFHDAIERGYRIGICANSDGHKGRPGTSYPGRSLFGSLGGLTCVLAEKLDRESIAKAMKERHFYATTGNRSLIDLELIAGNGEKAMMGDVVEISDDKATLNVKVAGTSAIESIDIFNGKTKIKTINPFAEKDLGNRVKITWSGAEKRGRNRLAIWDGSLKIAENAIKDIVPINFWNKDAQPQLLSKNEVSWKSITTGGVSGVILSLDKKEGGVMEIETPHKNIKCEINSIGIAQQIWECGGVEKQIEVVRLPEKQESNEFSFSLPIINLNEGDNPIYIRVNQEDGHKAWTSPVYLAKEKAEN